MSPLDKRTCSTETYCSVFASFVLYWILQQIKKCNGILNKYLPDSFNLNIFGKKKKKVGAFNEVSIQYGDFSHSIYDLDSITIHTLAMDNDCGIHIFASASIYFYCVLILCR